MLICWIGAGEAVPTSSWRLGISTGATRFVTSAISDWRFIALGFVASTHLYTFSSSILIHWVDFVCWIRAGGDAVGASSWIWTISTSATRFVTSAISDWRFIALGFIASTLWDLYTFSSSILIHWVDFVCWIRAGDAVGASSWIWTISTSATRIVTSAIRDWSYIIIIAIAVVASTHLFTLISRQNHRIRWFAGDAEPYVSAGGAKITTCIFKILTGVTRQVWALFSASPILRVLTNAISDWTIILVVVASTRDLFTTIASVNTVLSFSIILRILVAVLWGTRIWTQSTTTSSFKVGSGSLRIAAVLHSIFLAIASSLNKADSK